MSYQLVIAEKPSVARSIAGVIGADKKQDGYMEGNGYLVSWCIGHLVSLADAGTYDERFKKWRYDDLPILPQQWQYIIPKPFAGSVATLPMLAVFVLLPLKSVLTPRKYPQNPGFSENLYKKREGAALRPPKNKTEGCHAPSVSSFFC